MPAPSFLVAERDLSLRQMLAEITAENFRDAVVFTARNEEEALAALPRLRPPCVAVLHWSLLDGGAATLAEFHNAGVPVLLTSAWNPTRVVGASPASVRLQKPFDLEDYVGRLRELLASWPEPGAGSGGR
ncbi:MAG TPA: hypothetical protein VGK85_01530 [Myxococcaceae bacterium]|jgi:hypothetical protein